ncbi:MAG: hypothetical protein A2087_11265 [Spirochaetes bacterium GWD1_61_31]|nr:MAG: hypothetical protein A2Y37_01265 [Spirochaetes bacterium GWB1_60_80]OHD35696.1 MAG: hypothetical protein A2087_11265 [Spirochaetes bacterium GWD1_61_31]OHD41833.1 MAG: hypothetical protein A2Y35_04360 [Spirochaetes bacterium GWE1_60_18]HAP42588.1 hypothetical protein [Spirochaetaceae bacterium]HAW84957.1 hypothetical protein [Spirochaetaceae bacterium]
MDANTIAEFDAAMQRKQATLPARIRPITRDWVELPRAFLLTGPRGVGKTTFLLHHSRISRVLYFSADNPLLADEPLYATVKSIFMAGYEGVVIAGSLGSDPGRGDALV